MAALNAEIPDELKRALDLACAQKDMTLKQAIAEAIQKWLGREDDQPDDPDLARVRYILEHSQRVVGLRSAIDLFYSDSKANPRPRENDKPKRKVG